jgi:pyruvate/2-oxoglutarate dehydrogenase complex dihydrolipoamide acyltransferase (E2) component
VLKSPEAFYPSERKILEVLTKKEKREIFAGDPLIQPAKMFDATDGAVSLANEYHVDLEKVSGTGSNGRITKNDVAQFIEDTIEI